MHKIYKLSLFIFLIAISISIDFAQARSYITIGDREYIQKYGDYTRDLGDVHGYNPIFSYPLAQFSAYSASQSYRNPVELREKGLVDSSNKYFGDILLKNNFMDVQLVHRYDLGKFEVEDFLKSYGGLWRFIRIGRRGNIDIESPKIKNLSRISTQAIVGYKWINVNGDRKRVISITFRGTEGLNKPEEIHEDWLVNAISEKINIHENIENVKVHRGYLSSVKAFQEQEEYIYLGNENLKEIIEKSKINNDIFIINGHSSGGAMAAIYGALLIDEKVNNIPRENVIIYSFGTPPFADETFKNRYFSSENISNMLNYHSIVERYDIVPYTNRGMGLIDYFRDVMGGIISENKYLNKSKLLGFLFRTDNPEFSQIGYEHRYEQGEYVDKSIDSSISTIDKIYFFIEEITQRRLKHHTMTWYTSILNEEALKHPRGDITRPDIYYEIDGEEIVLFSNKNAKIYYSFDEKIPIIKPYEYTGGYRRVKKRNSKLIFFAIDNYGNMSDLKAIDLRKRDYFYNIQ